MVSAMEVKLLTLLNVSAVKRPREQDIPGGHRGSPALSSSNRGSRQASLNISNAPHVEGQTPPPVVASPSNETDAEPAAKRRRSVVFGGEVGPSGSTYGAKKAANGDGGTKLGKGSTKANGAAEDGKKAGEFEAFQAFADGPDSGDEAEGDEDDDSGAGELFPHPEGASS